MPLRDFMTQTASTKRHPAKSGMKIGDPVTNLTNLYITSLMLMDAQSSYALQKARGLDGTLGQLWQAYTESHTHTDSGVSVTQVPDIIAGDKLVIGSTTYHVQWADVQAATTGFGKTLILYVFEDVRA